MVTIKKGFSLIELLVVIALIGILTAIATASYSTMQKKARDSRRVSDLKAIQNGMEQYMAENKTYPSPDCFNATVLTYLPDGFPLDPKELIDYSSRCPDGVSYCFCGGMEVANGNSDGDCAGLSGNYYCVYQRQ